MKNKHFNVKIMALLCLMITLLWSCQNDDQNDPTPLSQEDYVAYESSLLDHMRHFGEQIRSSNTLGFDDESLKSISSSYFEGDDHDTFVNAIDNPNTEPVTSILQAKIENLQSATEEFDEHTAFLSHLNDQFNLELQSDELEAEDKNILLSHIIHLRVVTQFIDEHQDLFLSPEKAGRSSDVDWWLVSGKCALRGFGSSVTSEVKQVDISELNQSSTSAKVLGTMRDVKANCNSKLFLAAFDFFTGLRTNPYCPNPPCSETTVYNMYSYGYLNSSRIVPDDNPPVENLDEFSLPSGDLDTVHTNFTAGEGPYIGKTSSGRHFALTDCSGFVSYILQKDNAAAYKEIFKTVQNKTNKGDSHLSYCPSAAQYANYDVTSSQYWTSVESDGKPDFGSIQAGDIIAWDEQQGNDKDSDTGHVMIAAGPSRQREDGCYYLVDIFDSTVDEHLNNQRFGIETEGSPTGVGLGTIGLKILTGTNELQSNFFPDLEDCFQGTDPWFTHPHITILRLKSN